MKGHPTPPPRKTAPPTIVKSGNVSVKIYTCANRGRPLFTLTYVDTKGKRVRQNFADLQQAKREALAAATRIQNGQAEALELVGADRRMYLRALELLRSTGDDLDFAVGHYAEAQRILCGAGTIVEAARFFARHHPVALPRKSVPEVFEEFKTAKRSDVASARYLPDIRSRLGRFSKHFLGPISEVGVEDIETWLASLGTGAVARNGTRSLLITFFNFARKRGYLPKDRATEADEIAKAKKPPGDRHFHA